MRRFRLLIATVSISSCVLFGMHEAVAQAIDAKSVEKANLKYQSQSNLKKTNVKRLKNKKQAAANAKAKSAASKGSKTVAKKKIDPVQAELNSLVDAELKRTQPKTQSKKVSSNSSRNIRTKKSVTNNYVTKRPTEIIEPWPVKTASSKIAAPIVEEKRPSTGTTFSGRVDFTVGENTNIDPDKVGIRDNFYSLSPSASFNTRISDGFELNGTVGATALDYTEQAISNIAKKTTANASLAAVVDFGQAKSTTTLSGLYNDEMWPDFIDENGDGIFDGMPIRYVESGIDQKFSFGIGILKLDVGGSFTRRDHTESYSDYAPEILGERRFEQDFNRLKGYGSVGLSAGKYVDFALNPSVTQTKYDDRLGRLSNGQVGGVSIIVPNYEIITSEVALDISFKFLDSSISPTGMIGQVRDQAAGAYDASYYGYGIKGDITLLKSINLKLSPSIVYKKSEYDNWTHLVPNGEKRVDDDVVSSIALSSMFTKNFGASIKYEQVKEKSSHQYTDENYRQQIIGTTLTLAF